MKLAVVLIMSAASALTAGQALAQGTSWGTGSAAAKVSTCATNTVGRVTYSGTTYSCRAFSEESDVAYDDDAADLGGSEFATDDCKITDEFTTANADNQCVEYPVGEYDEETGELAPNGWVLAFKKVVESFFRKVVKIQKTRWGARLDQYCGTDGGTTNLINWVNGNSQQCATNFCASKFTTAGGGVNAPECKQDCDTAVSNACTGSCGDWATYLIAETGDATACSAIASEGGVAAFCDNNTHAAEGNCEDQCNEQLGVAVGACVRR